ncbi:MAG: Abortive infection protein [Phycisphaerales bacterium]|nr:Abortive infection protein [Phycisphaerales bacterium]
MPRRTSRQPPVRAAVPKPDVPPNVPAARNRLGYLAASERPWASLVFLLPFVLAYEAYALGWIGQPTTPGGTPRHAGNIVAFLLIEQTLALLGRTARHFPAFVLVAMLLGAHLWRNDGWRVRPSTVLCMAGEAVGWAVPLVVLGWVSSRYVQLAAGDHVSLIAKCLGAGIYEELVFRLLGVTVLTVILKDVAGLPNPVAVACSLLGSAVLFSSYHYLSPGEQFRPTTFLFRAAAGGYFGLLYALRGFGVTAGSHAAYDLIVVTCLAT